MTAFTEADLSALEALAKAATPGPWKVEYTEIGPYGSPDLKLVAFVKTEGEDGEYIVVDEEPNVLGEEPSPNAAYIVAACNAVPDLIAALRASEAREKDLVEALQPFANEEETWSRSVADRYHPGILEPNQKSAHAKALFCIGDLRRAARLLADCETGKNHDA